MKTTIFKTGLSLALFSMLFTSCEKSESGQATPAVETKSSMKDLVSNPQFIAAYKQMEDAYKINNPDLRAQFIAPFFTSDGFGIAQNIVLDCSAGPYCMITEGQFAFFQADLDGNDFYRENNDGTVSVHVNSNSAFADHYDIASNVDMFTESGHLAMDYTGPVVTFDITDQDGNVLFTVTFVDINANPNAVSFHGNGQVRENGTGPKHNLVGKVVANPGWTQTNIGFTLN